MFGTRYVVAALVGTRYKGCMIVEEGSIIIATHTIVFGPDTRENCEAWKKRHCG